MCRTTTLISPRNVCSCVCSCRYRNDVQFATYRKWRKVIRTVTLRRPDMWRPVRVAIDDEVDLPMFFHSE
jgi:hypothetical protein